MCCRFERAMHGRVPLFIMWLGCLACAPVFSQTNTFPASGSVGIGTTSPGRMLHLSATGQPSVAFSDLSGTAGNRTAGFVYDGGYWVGGIGGLVFQDFSDAGLFLANRLTFWKDGSVNFGGIVRPATAGQVVFTGGNVGIGTISPQYRLSVNGTIGTKEVIVTNSNWSDYVFQSGYRLKPLTEVATYIRQHHHLPAVPTEAEVKANGIGLGEMQGTLLAKIEELTLYMIEADRKNDELHKRNVELEERLARLEATFARSSNSSMAAEHGVLENK